MPEHLPAVNDAEDLTQEVGEAQDLVEVVVGEVMLVDDRRPMTKAR